MAGGPLQFLDDYSRILSNGLTFGLADKAVHAITGKDEAAATAAARQRQGLAGDVANVATMLAGGRGVVKAVRAAPTVIPALARQARVGLANLGGPGLTRAEAAARLGIDYVPTLAERGLSAAGRAVGNVAAYPFQHPILSALTGAGGLAAYASRSNDGVARAAPAPAPAPATQMSDNRQDAVPQEVLDAAKQVAGGNSAPQNPEFSQLVGMAAAANGGKINLRQLSALADVAYKTVPRRSVKSPGIADIAGQRALELGEQLTQQRMAQAAASGDKQAYANAVQEQIDRYERLARARAIDPVTAYNLGLPEDDGN